MPDLPPPLGNDPITRNHRDAWLRQLRHWSRQEAADGSAVLLFAFIVPAQESSDPGTTDLAIDGLQRLCMGTDILLWHNRGRMRMDAERRRFWFFDAMEGKR
jgi:hypothetical protein